MCIRDRQSTQPARYSRFQVSAVHRIPAQGPGHCTIGRKQGRIRSKAEAVKEGEGVVGAAAGGDGDDDSGLLRGPERLRGSGADSLRKGGKQRAVPVSYTHLDVYKRQRWG